MDKLHVNDQMFKKRLDLANAPLSSLETTSKNEKFKCGNVLIIHYSTTLNLIYCCLINISRRSVKFSTQHNTIFVIRNDNFLILNIPLR